MATYPNFYQNIVEANMRLKGTVVLYEGAPYYVWGVTDHKPDGVFRVYMTEVDKVTDNVSGNPFNSVHGMHPLPPTIGPAMDTFMEGKEIFRKKMNSPGFNKFRPFPLGMVNYNEYAVYAARQPARPKTEQGLTPNMLFCSKISASDNTSFNFQIEMYSNSFKDCVLGKYPSPNTVIEGLQNPKYANESVAFNREFALVRGPIDIIFLAHREDIIGVLPHGDFTKVRIGKEHKHTKEVVEELNLFYHVSM